MKHTIRIEYKMEVYIYIRYLFFLSLNHCTQRNRSNEMQANTISTFGFNNKLMNGIARNISGHNNICNNFDNKKEVHLRALNSVTRE